MSEKSSPQRPTSDIIAELVEVRNERRQIALRDKELVEKYRSLEMEMIVRLEEQGMTKASTDTGTASITETVLPQVVDWEALYEYIRDNDAFYLLQKRPATSAFRELFQSDQPTPGVEQYTKKSISLRKSS